MGEGDREAVEGEVARARSSRTELERRVAAGEFGQPRLYIGKIAANEAEMSAIVR